MRTSGMGRHDGAVAWMLLLVLHGSFASRKAALPGADGGRFRMRVQRSPADIVQAVGTYLFAPPGYDPDPCPRNRANIQGLITQGDSPALQYELEFERKHCRS